MAEIVSLDEVKDHLSSLVDRVTAGEEIIISKKGIAVARLAPIVVDHKRRTPAGAIGIKFIAEDFDAPLPEELLAAFDGKYSACQPPASASPRLRNSASVPGARPRNAA
jgi:prevent-host-death family protein